MKLANFHDAFDTIKKISTKLARDNDFAMTKKTSKVHKKTTFDAKTNQHSFAKQSPFRAAKKLQTFIGITLLTQHKKNVKLHKIGCFDETKKIKIQLITTNDSVVQKEEEPNQTLVYSNILTHIHHPR